MHPHLQRTRFHQIFRTSVLRSYKAFKSSNHINLELTFHTRLSDISIKLLTQALWAPHMFASILSSHIDLIRRTIVPSSKHQFTKPKEPSPRSTADFIQPYIRGYCVVRI